MFAFSQRSGMRLGDARGWRAIVGRRQIDTKTAAFSQSAGDDNRAVVIFDYTVHHVEAQPSALAGSFGSEERLKDALLSTAIHSHAGVAYLQTDMRSFPEFRVRT